MGFVWFTSYFCIFILGCLSIIAIVYKIDIKQMEKFDNESETATDAPDLKIARIDSDTEDLTTATSDLLR